MRRKLCYVLSGAPKGLLGTFSVTRAYATRPSTFSLAPKSTSRVSLSSSTPVLESSKKPSKAANKGLRRGALKLNKPVSNVSLPPKKRHKHAHMEEGVNRAFPHKDVPETLKYPERMALKNEDFSSSNTDFSRNREQNQFMSQFVSTELGEAAGDTGAKPVKDNRNMRSLLLLVLERAASALCHSNRSCAVEYSDKLTTDSFPCVRKITVPGVPSVSKHEVFLNLMHSEGSGIQPEFLPSLRDDIDLFAHVFAATLQSARPHSVVNCCAMSRVARSVSPSSCLNDLSSIIPTLSERNSWSQSVEVLKTGEVQILEESLHHITARARHALQPDVDCRDAFVQRLVEAIDAAVIPTGILGTQTQFTRDGSGKDISDGINPQHTVPNSGALESLADILENLALKLHLAYVLLEERHNTSSRSSSGSEASDPEKLWMVEVGRRLLRSVSSDDKIYEFCALGPGKEGRIDSIEHTKIKGFSSLLGYAIKLKTADAKQAIHVSHRRELVNARTALHYVLSLYLCMLPDIVADQCDETRAQCSSKAAEHMADAASVLESSISNASKGIHEQSGDHKGTACHRQLEREELRVLSSLSESWFMHQHALRIEGAGAAIDWLRLVPVLMSSIASVVERSLELVGLSLIPTNPCESHDVELNRLTSVSQKLSLLLNNMLFYDSLAFEATRQVTPANTVLEADDNHPSKAQTEIMGDTPVQRFRRKRSIFNKGKPSDGGVLREVGEDAAPLPLCTNQTGKRDASRFVVRSAFRAGNDAIEDGDRAHGAPGQGREGFSALFRAFVLSQDAVPLLVSAFPISNSRGEINLSEIWVEMIHSMGYLQQLLYGNPPPLPTHLAATHLKWDSTPSKGVQGLIGGDDVVCLSDREGVKNCFADRYTEFLTNVPLDRFPHLLSLGPISSANNLQYRRSLNILCRMQKMIPLRLFDSTLRIASTLMKALLVLYEKAKQLEPLSLGRSPAYYWDVTRQKDELQFCLQLGGRELIWGNTSFAFAKGFQLVWKMRLALCCGASRSPRQVLLSNVLAQKISQAVKLISKFSLHRPDMIPPIMKTSISILQVWTSSCADGTLNTCQAPLSVFGAQMCAVCILVGASAVNSAHRGRPGNPTPLTSYPPEMNKVEPMLQLIQLLSSNHRLLLMCCYPAFLNSLYDVILRTVGAQEELVTQFIVRHLFPVSITMILVSLHNSKNFDTLSAHASLCEQTLLLLPVLATFTEYPNYYSKGKGGVHSDARELLQPWSDILMSTSIYCLRLAKGQNGVVQSGDLHFGPPFLPLPSSLPAPISEDVSALLKDLLTRSTPLRRVALHVTTVANEGANHTTDPNMTDDCTRSFLRFLHHCNDLFPSTAFHRFQGSHFDQMLDALHAYSSELENSISFSAFADINSSVAMDVPKLRDIADKKRAQRYLHSMMTEMGNAMAKISDTTDDNVLVSFERQYEMAQRWYLALAAAEVSVASRVACTDFHQHTINAQLLVKLMRFLAKNARQALRQSSMQVQLHEAAFPGTGTPAAAKEVCLIALDHIGRISVSGGWAMVYWVFGVAEVAVASERVTQRCTSATTRTVVVSSIFHQLRAVPPPRRGYVTPGSFLYLPKVLVGLSDILSRERSKTLLGDSRWERLKGLLVEPSADELRTITFAIKQSILYIESGTRPLRRIDPVAAERTDSTEEEEIAFESADRDALTDTDRFDAFSRVGSGGPVASYYDGMLNGDAESTPRGEEKRNEFRQLMHTIVVAFDVILECTLHHLSRQDAMQEDLMIVATISYNLLCRIFRECVSAYTELPVEYRSRFNRREFGMMLWAGLSVVATVSRAWCADNSAGTILFVDRVSQSSWDLVHATQRLVDCLCSGDALEKGNGDTVELRQKYPVCCTLMHSLRDLTQGASVSVSGRIGITNHHCSNDNFTAVLSALNVLVKSATQHSATVGVARAVCERVHIELASAVDAHKRRLGDREGAAEVRGDDTALFRVPSLKELERALIAFRNAVPPSNGHPDTKSVTPGSEAVFAQSAYHHLDDLLHVFEENSAASLSQRGTSLSEEGEHAEGAVVAGAAFPSDTFFSQNSSSLEPVVDLYVEEVLAGETLPVGKVVDMVIQQAKCIFSFGCPRLSSSHPTFANGSGFDFPHAQQQVAAYVRNLLGLFNACSFATICQNLGVEVLFTSLKTLVELEGMEEGIGEGSTSTFRTTNKGSYCTETLLSIKQLWKQLCSKVQRELIEPNETEFHKCRGELAALFRSHPSGQPKGRRLPGLGSEPDMFTFVASDAHREERALFSVFSAKLPNLRSSATDSNAAYEALLFPEPDVGCGLSSDTVADPVLKMTVSTAGRLERPLPLSIVFVLLRVFSGGSPESDELRLLVESVCTYVSRQYVLLRPRLEDTALNVMPLLGLLQPWLACIQDERDRAPRPDHASVEEETGQLNAEIARCGIVSLFPLADGCAKRVRGVFFRPKLRAQLRRYFAAASGPKGELSMALERSGSEEILTFEYIRGATVYLHLLALQVVVLSRFKLQGSIVEKLELSLKQKAHDQIQSAKRWKAQSDSGSGGGTAQATDPSASLPLSMLLHEDYATWMATLDEASSNPFLAALQHLANISFVLLRHTDNLTQFAAVQAMCGGRHDTSTALYSSEKLATMCTAFADELRHLTATSLQGVFKSILSTSDYTSPPLARVVVQHLISRFPCEAVVSDIAVPSAATKKKEDHRDPSQLHRHWRLQRPEWFVASPSMLDILTPTFFVNCLSTSHMARPSAPVVSSVAASLLVYARRKDIALSPLLVATTALLGTTSNRNAAVRLLCESLAQEMLKREDFLHALAPPTVATPVHGATGPISNEVLIPFLAALAREDIRVSKRTLADLLHTVMRMRADVFGQPPTASWRSMLSLLRPLNGVDAGGGDFVRQARPAGSLPFSSSLEGGASGKGGADGGQPGGREGEGAAPHTKGPHQQVRDVEGEELAALDAFTIHQSNASALTHRQALEKLNISLPTTFEVAMHLKAIRRPNKEEHRHAVGMLKAADDARRERIGACGLLVNEVCSTAQRPSSSGEPLEGSKVDHEIEREFQGKLDASLHLKDHMDYGVALLHLRFALRKIIHASFRRLARHQLPSALADMTEALYEVDKASFSARRKQWRLGREANAATHVRQDALRDPMLIGTLRVISTRAILCAQSIGYNPNGTPTFLKGISQDGDPTRPRAGEVQSPLLLPNSFISSSRSTWRDRERSLPKVGRMGNFASPTALEHLEREGSPQKIPVEANAAIEVSSSGTRIAHQSRLRIMHALFSMKRKRIGVSGVESFQSVRLDKHRYGGREGTP